MSFFGIKSAKVIKKVFDSDPVFNEKSLKAKTKLFEEKVNTNFQNDKMPKEGSHCICLSVVLIDSVFKMGRYYNPQVFLEECKYIVKEKKMPKYITDDIQISSNDSGKKNSNEGSSDESDKENFNEEKRFEEEIKISVGVFLRESFFSDKSIINLLHAMFLIPIQLLKQKKGIVYFVNYVYDFKLGKKGR